jgi:hypothetical protein
MYSEHIDRLKQDRMWTKVGTNRTVPVGFNIFMNKKATLCPFTQGRL